MSHPQHGSALGLPRAEPANALSLTGHSANAAHARSRRRGSAAPTVRPTPSAALAHQRLPYAALLTPRITRSGLLTFEQHASRRRPRSPGDAITGWQSTSALHHGLRGPGPALPIRLADAQARSYPASPRRSGTTRVSIRRTSYTARRDSAVALLPAAPRCNRLCARASVASRTSVAPACSLAGWSFGSPAAVSFTS